MADFLLYGSYGYTGQLIAELAVQSGLTPLLAGRSLPPLKAQMQALKLEGRAFALSDRAALDAALLETPLVLNCAGPFSQTYPDMVAACLRQGRHYLDITGEVQVFEALAALDEQARAAKVTLLPGVGFDVVPSDCLAAHLKRRLPGATHLRLGIRGLGGGASQGTLRTMVEGLGNPGAVRQDGKLVSVPQGSRTWAVDFGRGPRPLLNIPWGDISTAYHTTGIPNIETYMAMPQLVTRLARVSGAFGFLLRSQAVKSLLRAWVKSLPAGPSLEQRQNGRSLLYGEAWDETGGRVAARLETPEAYRLTALTAVAAVQRLLNGAAKPGFQTPAGAFGPDFILEFEGVQRQDL